jgi:hypothetical protein
VLLLLRSATAWLHAEASRFQDPEGSVLYVICFKTPKATLRRAGWVVIAYLTCFS